MSELNPRLATDIPQTTTDGTGSMFDRIARRYNLMNNIISFGLHHKWRSQLLATLGNLKPNDEVLDVATGTGDVALSIAEHFSGVHITGLDPSSGMLEVGEAKRAKYTWGHRVHFVEGDAQHMTFESNRFAAACVSFGIRNVPNRLQGLKEMKRVTRPGGRIAVLELSEPESGWLAPIAKWHIHHVIPTIGNIFSGAKEYNYLQNSIAAFPPPAHFVIIMEEAGIQNITVKRLTFGSAHLYVGTVSKSI